MSETFRSSDKVWRSLLAPNSSSLANSRLSDYSQRRRERNSAKSKIVSPAKRTFVRSFVRRDAFSRFFRIQARLCLLCGGTVRGAFNGEGIGTDSFLEGIFPECELHYALFSLRHPVSLRVVLRANARVNARFDAASLYGPALGNVFSADFHAVLSAEMIARLFPNGWITPFRSRLCRLARRYVHATPFRARFSGIRGERSKQACLARAKQAKRFRT